MHIPMDAQISVDFEDVRTVMNERGVAMMATATGPDRTTRTAEAAVAKVDAQASQRSDAIEIPAFVCQQAD